MPEVKDFYAKTNMDHIKPPLSTILKQARDHAAEFIKHCRKNGIELGPWPRPSMAIDILQIHSEEAVQKIPCLTCGHATLRMPPGGHLWLSACAKNAMPPSILVGLYSESLCPSAEQIAEGDENEKAMQDVPLGPLMHFFCSSKK